MRAENPFYGVSSMKSLKDIAAQSVLSERDLEKIESIILGHGSFTPEAIRQDIEWFCTGLVMSDYYFKSTPLETIANHIEALRAAEIITRITQEKLVKVDLGTERENGAVYLVDDNHYRAWEIERRIEERYPGFRVQSYRTVRKALGLEYLRLYLVSRPDFPKGRPTCEETDLARVADKTFLAAIPPAIKDDYVRLLDGCRGWETPLIDVSRERKTRELRIMVAAKHDASQRFFSNISDVLHSHGFVSNRKYIEPLANGKTVFSIYLDDFGDEAELQNLVEDISLVYVIPDSPLSDLFRQGKLTTQETVFGVSLWSFAHQFLSAYNDEYVKLAEELKDSPELLGTLRNLRLRLAKETYTENRVWDVLTENPSFIKQMYAVFDKRLNPRLADRSIQDEAEAIRKDIHRNVSLEVDRDVLLTGLHFIDIIQRTNFYKKEKTSLSFMYRPDVLNPVDYPEKPFGLFQVIGADFRGFHIRFRDIARGGIRIVRSTHFQNYLTNSDLIFDENYNLAFTQQKKNKDLAEGGSKGTILLNWGFMDKSESAFKKYIDGLLDLMLPDESVVDYYGRPVLLFLGPDEGTADLMEWAALRARDYGYPYWKAFSTGKPVALGGIPHDLYAMTTNSVHQYVLEALAKLGLKEENVTKVMTGGPDGDLGSNEILISKDRILAIVDGSGVLYDPQGIDRAELEKLAKTRRTVEHFPKAKLSPRGFLVHVRDSDVTLPGGEKVESGLEFRNTFHLNPRFQADLFVPCGGRPSSVNINNWRTYLNDTGEPRFKIIVEGANLFLTQQARLRLEEKGVILYKDASANKGGVTSSSLEVLSGLALTDEEYDRLMCVRDGVISPFRRAYIDEIIDIVKANARDEFELIWKENARTGTPRAVLTDLVSEKINAIKDAINASDLAEDEARFRKALECCVPKALTDLVGFEGIMKRVPKVYLKALFAASVAGRYVYTFGLEADAIDFYEFLKDLK
jgi:glutamate dehydrogenase